MLPLSILVFDNLIALPSDQYYWLKEVTSPTDHILPENPFTRVTTFALKSIAEIRITNQEKTNDPPDNPPPNDPPDDPPPDDPPDNPPPNDPPDNPPDDPPVDASKPDPKPSRDRDHDHDHDDPPRRPPGRTLPPIHTTEPKPAPPVQMPPIDLTNLPDSNPPGSGLDYNPNSGIPLPKTGGARRPPSIPLLIFFACVAVLAALFPSVIR